MNQKTNIYIATHNGAHHADDVFGVAVLRMLNPNAEVIRTRDASLVEECDFAVDVGGEWDPARGRFDHHQKGFAGKRDNGVTYASAGLVWAAHGKDLVAKLAPQLSADDVARVWQCIDDELVQHLDMADTGTAQGAPGYFGLSALLSAFNTTRSEEAAIRENADYPNQTGLHFHVANMKGHMFTRAMDFVELLLQRLVAQVTDELASAALVRGAETRANGRILVLAESGLSWSKVVCHEMPDVLFVVYPDSSDQQYQVRTVPVEPESFTARKDLPADWAGLRHSALAEVCGVSDAVFCHNGRFIGGAASLEGAVRMAELALQA